MSWLEKSDKIITNLRIDYVWKRHVKQSYVDGTIGG